ncbi:MAG: right-handed parallel beta-helix repeat-containing protein [Myxococcota bacterium]
MLPLLLSASAAWATVVPGGVIGTTTWTAANSPYVVQGDITVPAGATLTIQAGVEVRTASSDASASGNDSSRVEIVVDGTLDVQGDLVDPVWFLSDTLTGSTSWYGIVVHAGGVLTGTEAVVQHATYGVYSAGSVDLVGFDASVCGTAAIYATDGAVTVSDADITGSSYGMRLSGAATVDAMDVRIYDTSSYGVYVNVNTAGAQVLDHLLVHSAGSTGVYVSPSGGAAPSVDITNSLLTSNSGWGVYSSGSAVTTLSYADVWGNGSGSTSGVALGVGILDENPLYVAAPTDYRLTSNSPARFAADDGGDLGADPYDGVPTPGLYGTLWADTTLAAGTYAVDGDLTVPLGVTLTLQPGVVLEAATSDLMSAHSDRSRVEVRVGGTLYSVGNATDPVVMRSSGSGTTAWYGLALLDTANAGIIDHTDIEEATYGIRYEAVANHPIRDVNLTGNGTAGLYVTAGGPVVSGATITGSSYGIRLSTPSSVSISDTTVYDTSSYGVYVNVSGTPTITLDRVTVHSAGSTGVYVSPSGGGAPVVDVTDAILTDNSGWGLYSSGSAVTTVSYSDVWRNGSGGTSGAAQGAGLLDENPLYVSAPGDLHLTSNSPARFAASDGGDLGANPFVGDPTVGLQGTLWTGMVMRAADSPYTLVGDLTVPLGQTLTIDPGVQLLAETSDTMYAHADRSRVELRVYGEISAVGTSFDPVVMESTGTSTTSWYGVRLFETATGELTNVSIAEATYGVQHTATAGVPLSYLHVERSGTAGLYIDGGAPAVDGLTVTGTSYGVRLTGADTGAVLTNCAIWDTSSYGLYVNVSGTPAISVSSCVVHSVGSTGIYVSPSGGGAPVVDISNSIVTSNSGWGVYSSGSAATTVSYSDVWSNGSGSTSGATQGAGILNTNPFFVDEPGRDFHLGATSPAIDAGTATGAPDHDLSGRPRPVDGNGLGGAEYDLGCYEFRDETPGMTATPGGAVVVTEAGGTRRLDVVLDAPPLGNVTLAVSSSDLSEGTVSPASLTYTPVNWAQPQSVTVTGVDDAVDDGEPAWTVTLDPSGSQDLDYRNVAPLVLAATTTDDDTAGLVLVGATGLRTTEVGGTDTFTVALASEPTTEVRLDLSSTDGAEGTVSPFSLSFTAANWSTPRTVTLTGVDDADPDGDQVWQVRLDPALSADPPYAALPATLLDVTNVDDETAGPGISVFGGPLATSEGGGTDAFDVVLDAAPTATVTIAVSSSDPAEATVSPVTLTFTTTDWSVPQQVVATGVDDGQADGDQPFTVVLAPAVSADPSYGGVDPDDVPGTNADDDRVEVVVNAIDPHTTEAVAARWCWCGSAPSPRRTSRSRRRAATRPRARSAGRSPSPPPPGAPLRRSSSRGWTTRTSTATRPSRSRSP